jgi:uncharacterized protein
MHVLLPSLSPILNLEPTHALNFLLRHCTSIDEIPRSTWNSLLEASDTPFIRHEFLSLLEDSGCVGPGTGWTPCHLLAEEETAVDGERGARGVMPLYLKQHSYGEYVFDWAWAHAYQQHGIAYYPKLVCAIPFTPVTSRKLLVRDHDPATSRAMINAIAQFATDNPLSSIHALFMSDEEVSLFEDCGYLQRHDNQFHWHNRGYHDFDDYLSQFTSKKRKNIRAERRRVAECGVRFQWLSAASSREVDWIGMYQLYRTTIAEHGGIPYLTPEFFLGLPRAMPDHALLLQGSLAGTVVCGALYFAGSGSLYGRYWGTNQFIPGLHFETCYYQPIAYAIEHGLDLFEAGAQGLHKLSRGLAPSTTRSVHWLSHPGFRDAVDRYLQSERHEHAQYTRVLRESLPFRHTPDEK